MGLILLWSFLAILAGGALSLALFSLLSRRPQDLGVHGGRLAPCPPSPNCVCTFETRAGHAMEPLTFAGTPQEALERLRGILRSMPRTRIVTEEGGYLHAEVTSLIFRFVDDVEILADPGAGVIHFRSAARAGHSDLGVNRRRMERIRELFQAGS